MAGHPMSAYAAEFFSLAIIHFLAVVAPGPDFAVTVQQSLAHGRRAGILTALGIGAGISVHVLYTLLGFSALMHSTPWLMRLAELIGSIYLLYLGSHFIQHAVRTARQTAASSAPAGTQPKLDHSESATVKATSQKVLPSDSANHATVQSARRAFWLGFFTNATNPKATIFFLAVFTTVVSAQTPLYVQAGYGLWMCMVNALWFIVVSLIFTQQRIRAQFLRIGHYVEGLIGVLLLFFALRLLWTLSQGLLT